MLPTLRYLTTAPVIAVWLVCVLGLVSQDDRAFVESQIRKWQEVVARNPKDVDALTAIGAGYGKLGEHATAVTYFNKAIAINPSFAGAYAGLGSAYGFLGRPAEAIAALKKAVSLDPRDAFGRLKLGTALGKAGRYPEAITELREAVRLKTDLADAHFALGVAYVSIRDRVNARNEVDALSPIDSRQAAQLQAIIDHM